MVHTRIGTVRLMEDGFSVHTRFASLKRWEKRNIQNVEKDLKRVGVLDEEDRIEGVYVEMGFGDPLREFKQLQQELMEIGEGDHEVQIHSRELYSVIESFQKTEAIVETKYKTVDKKVKPVAQPLPSDASQQVQKASTERRLRDPRNIGHRFTEASLKELKIGSADFLLPVEKQKFQEMLARHGKAFSFDIGEIGCVDPRVVAPMIIFTVPHAPWDLRPIPVPRAHLPKLMELLKEKMKMKILEPSFGPYSSRWFTVPKKNGALRFIQDMQPVNQVTIRNTGIGPIVGEFAEAFAGRAVYSVGDLHSGYD